MSNELKVVVGLDIGTTKICAIVGKTNEHGKVEVLAMGKSESLGVIRGEVRNIERTKTAIIDAIEKAKVSLLKNSPNMRIEINSVHVGIAGQHIKSLQHQNSISRTNSDIEISQEDVDRLTKDTYNLALPPGDAIIHVLPQEYTVDDIGDVIDPVGMSGIRLSSNFNIITGNVDAIRNITRSVERADLKIADLILEPLSSAEAVLSQEEMDAGVCLVDIGGGTTDVAIFKKGIIRHTAVIPFGGQIITRDIEEGCNVLNTHAELLKIKFGSALASENKDNEVVSLPSLRGRPSKEILVKNLAHVIQARVEEIFESVLFEIKSSGLEKKLNAGIVITGGGSQLKHLDKLVEFVTGIDTRIGYANEHLGKTSFLDEIKSPMYATGVGLMMKGLKSIEHTEEEMELPVSETTDKPKNKAIGLIQRILDKGNKYLFDSNENMQDY
jgi:cell division protein FtsA